MLNIDLLKDQLKKAVVNQLSTIDGIVSITFVGSFESATDISLISDIDIIVIVDRLSGDKFSEIENGIYLIKSNDIGLNDYQIKLNTSFGPLKFNSDKTVVFHVMVYDISGHRKHVIESPFTCLDWEYFPAIYGKNLSEIYSAFGVQLDDLISSRRGLDAYLDDIKRKQITFRKYDFSTQPYLEKKHTYLIDDRHQKEYAYHIIKFLQLNLIKILFQTNQRFSVKELSDRFSKLNPSFKNHADFLIELHGWKYENKSEPKQVFERLELFVSNLYNWIIKLKLLELSFFRHEKTPLNDGTFLGVRRNPGIIEPLKMNNEAVYDQVFTGTLLRTVETGKLFKTNELNQNSLLNEIDYGLAEGLDLNELNEKFPELIESWKKGEDPKFPDGESQLDVQNRILKFLDIEFTKNKTAVITHNVVLRALLGNTYKFPVNHWYKINIKHLEAHHFQIYNKVLIPNLSKEQQLRYKDAVTGYCEPIVKFGIFWIPGDELNQFVNSWKNKCRKLEPDAIYLEHPVHLTLFLFHAYEKDSKHIISSLKPGKIQPQISDWQIFENDVLTTSDTLTIAFKQTTEILEFQSQLAESLLPFIRKPIDYPNSWEGSYKDSYDRYGFPFVGSHWIPHLTIASVKGAGKSIIKEIKATNINVNETLKGQIALFKIAGNIHECIHVWS